MTPKLDDFSINEIVINIHKFVSENIHLDSLFHVFEIYKELNYLKKFNTPPNSKPIDFFKHEQFYKFEDKIRRIFYEKTEKSLNEIWISSQDKYDDYFVFVYWKEDLKLNKIFINKEYGTIYAKFNINKISNQINYNNIYKCNENSMILFDERPSNIFIIKLSDLKQLMSQSNDTLIEEKAKVVAVATVIVKRQKGEKKKIIEEKAKVVAVASVAAYVSHNSKQNLELKIYKQKKLIKVFKRESEIEIIFKETNEKYGRNSRKFLQNYHKNLTEFIHEFKINDEGNVNKILNSYLLTPAEKQSIFNDDDGFDQNKVSNLINKLDKINKKIEEGEKKEEKKEEEKKKEKEEGDKIEDKEENCNLNQTNLNGGSEITDSVPGDGYCSIWATIIGILEKDNDCNVIDHITSYNNDIEEFKTELGEIKTEFLAFVEQIKKNYKPKDLPKDLREYNLKYIKDLAKKTLKIMNDEKFIPIMVTKVGNFNDYKIFLTDNIKSIKNLINNESNSNWIEENFHIQIISAALGINILIKTTQGLQYLITPKTLREKLLKNEKNEKDVYIRNLVNLTGLKNPDLTIYEESYTIPLIKITTNGIHYSIVANDQNFKQEVWFKNIYQNWIDSQNEKINKESAELKKKYMIGRK